MALLFCFSCSDFLDVELQKSQLESGVVFSDENTATSAVVGIYHRMLADVNSFASGGSTSISTLCALSADELERYDGNAQFEQFEHNALNSENTSVLYLWSSMYKTIYQANAILEGLANSKGIASEVKDQLKGEAYFVRAFTYFYLVNLFGPAPIILSTDYNANARANRMPEDAIYATILSDVNSAQALLNPTYIDSDRARPNKAAADALLARVHLYLGHWTEAQENATTVIDNAALYHLEENLDDVYLASSHEAIWQLKPVSSTNYTNEAFTLIIRRTPPGNILRETLVAIFDQSDLRRTHWIGAYTTENEIFYFPYKYKIATAVTQATEYSTVLRLAELFLVRAEAKAMAGDLPGAIADVDAIRARAQAPLLAITNPGLTQAELLLAIQEEWRKEFFTEWGHRWLNLKRWNKVTSELSAIKPGDWQPTDVLYPVPQSELHRNPFLGSQNAGY